MKGNSFKIVSKIFEEIIRIILVDIHKWETIKEIIIKFKSNNKIMLNKIKIIIFNYHQRNSDKTQN